MVNLRTHLPVMALPSVLSFFQSPGVETVHLSVGRNQTQFTVHKRLICSASAVFDRTFNGGFKEAIEGNATYPDDDPIDFEMFISWLYQRNVITSHYTNDIQDSHDTSHQEFTEKLVDLYVFADKYDCKGFQNFIMDTIQDASNSAIDLDLDDIQMIFDRTFHIPGTNLQKFCISTIHYENFRGTLDPEETAQFLMHAPEAFKQYLQLPAKFQYRKLDMNACPSVRKYKDSRNYHRCFFHTHDSYNKEADCTTKPNLIE